MSDTIVCPRIIWRVDITFLNTLSKSYCQYVYILRSLWKLIIETDEKLDDYKIYIMPENPEVYLNTRFLVQCGIRDIYGTLRFERFQTTTTENLLKCCVWRAGRRLILDEHVMQSNWLWVVCTVEPESSWEDCQVLANPSAASSSRTSMPCTDSLISEFKFLLKQSLHSDVVLECDNKIIKAHRSILSCRSRMFEGMFRNDTKEAIEGKVVINNTPFYVLEKLIHYIYTTEINLKNIKFACRIYVEADKFLVESLKDKCRRFFKDNFCLYTRGDKDSGRVSDACRVLCLADKHADIPLKCWIEEYLADSSLLVTPEWNNFANDFPDEAIEVYLKLLHKVKFGKSNFL